jgi:phosphoglycolate phosphatase-like HAD superfamily hydrolase
MVEAFKRSLADDEIEEDADEILSYMKKSQIQAIEYYTGKHSLNEDFVKRFIKYEDDTDSSKRIPFEGVIDICKKVIESGGRNFIVTHRDSSTEKILGCHGMLGLFTEIVTKHNGFKRKPDPEAFLYILDKYEINKSDALGIGDRELDIMAAHNAGIRTCLFKSNEVACSIKPDYTIDSLHMLENIILGR